MLVTYVSIVSMARQVPAILIILTEFCLFHLSGTAVGTNFQTGMAKELGFL